MLLQVFGRAAGPSASDSWQQSVTRAVLPALGYAPEDAHSGNYGNSSSAIGGPSPQTSKRTESAERFSSGINTAAESIRQRRQAKFCHGKDHIGVEKTLRKDAKWKTTKDETRKARKQM